MPRVLVAWAQFADDTDPQYAIEYEIYVNGVLSPLAVSAGVDKDPSTEVLDEVRRLCSSQDSGRPCIETSEHPCRSRTETRSPRWSASACSRSAVHRSCRLQNEPSAGPDERAHHHRQRSRSEPTREPGQPTRMVPVPVTEDDGVHRCEVDSESVGVGHHGVWREAGVEGHRRRRTASAHGDQCGIAMLGDQTDVRGAGFELRSLGGSGSEGRSRDPVVADQERVVEVVDQGCDDDLVDRREGDRVDRGAGR